MPIHTLGSMEPTAPQTEAAFTLSLTEYEASVVTGALAEFGQRWPEETETAEALRALVRAGLPREWTEA